MRELEGLSRWILRIMSRIMTGIMWRIMTVFQELNSPKNLFWRLKWVEENESCPSAFVSPVSLNLP